MSIGKTHGGSQGCRGGFMVIFFFLQPSQHIKQNGYFGLSHGDLILNPTGINKMYYRQIRHCLRQLLPEG